MKRLAVAACVVAFAAFSVQSQALTVAQFVPIRAALSNEVLFLSEIEDPSKADLKRLKVLNRASALLTNTTTDDGKALRSLFNILKSKNFPDYAPLLHATGTNLVHSYNKNYQFVSNLVFELPPSEDADLAQKQLKMLNPLVVKLNASDLANKVANTIDPARRRMDGLLSTIARGLIPVFPGDLSRNTIAARANGINMRVSRDHASENSFDVTETETNLVIVCSAVDGTTSDATGGRGLVLSIPNVAAGTFRYPVPDQAAVTFRTGVYSGNEQIFQTTSGAVFVSTQGDEIFGVFSASGEDITIAEGRFRLDLPVNSAFASPPSK